MTFHCIVTDNVVLGARAVSVRVGEAGALEARSRVSDTGGPGARRWPVLLENPGDVGAWEGAPGMRTLRLGWVTYVRSGGQDEAVSLPCVQTYSWVSSS